MKHIALAAVVAAVALGASAGFAQQASAPQASQQRPPRPSFSADGVVHVPAFDLPASMYLSAEARALQQGRANTPQFDGGAAVSGAGASPGQLRAAVERQVAPYVAAQQQRYAVNMTEQTIAGVRTRVFTPQAGEANRRRVLIHLHGGGFTSCAYGCALLESIPIAAVGRFRVISVDYRMAPEHRFPAASEDIAAVYRVLLRTYRPENIGVYGCSAGGSLSAQAVSWFQSHDLPNPGAIGIFGAGASPFFTGDSAHITAYIDGSFPAPGPDGRGLTLPYFEGVSLTDPLISPALHADIIARFPPTLIITGTRAVDMSPAIFTHTELLKAGIDSQLIVAEGMGHCYINDPNLPESRDAYAIIARFFDAHLGRRPRR